MQAGLGRQLKEAEAILAEENADALLTALLPVVRKQPRKISQRLFFL